MRKRATTVALTALALAAFPGCSAPTVDYSSLTPGGASVTSVEPTATPKSTSTDPTPIAEYLFSVGVAGEQVDPKKLKDLTVTLPRPPGWTTLDNPNLSPGTEAIARNNGYPRAMVVVLKLTGNFDVAAALQHADDDAELSKDFIRLNYSDADFAGFPSAMIEGSYDAAGVRLHSYNRMVIPVTPAPEFQRYLVQFTVTTLANKAAEQAPEVEQIIRGFNVAVK